jgi:hypothetical protein
MALPNAVRWPDICCCCLEPTSVRYTLEHVRSLVLLPYILFARADRIPIPMCPVCVRSYRWGRTSLLLSWAVPILVICMSAAVIVGPDPGSEWIMGTIALLTIVGATIAAPGFARVLWAKRRGHVHGCQAAFLSANRRCTFGNRAFAREARKLNAGGSHGPK